MKFNMFVTYFIFFAKNICPWKRICRVYIPNDIIYYVSVLIAVGCSPTLTIIYLGNWVLQVRMTLKPSLNSGIFHA